MLIYLECLEMFMLVHRKESFLSFIIKKMLKISRNTKIKLNIINFLCDG